MTSGAVRTGSARADRTCAAVRYPWSRISASTVFRRSRLRSGCVIGSKSAGPLGIAASEAASAMVSRAADFPK